MGVKEDNIRMFFVFVLRVLGSAAVKKNGLYNNHTVQASKVGLTSDAGTKRIRRIVRHAS